MARQTLIAGLFVLGCGQPPAVATTAPHPVPAFEPGRITLAMLDEQVGRTVCSREPAPATWPAKPMKLRVYDFTPIPIALAFGPTELQPSEGFRRYGDSIRVAIINQTERLAACMRAAIGTKPAMRRDVQINRGELVTIRLAMTIDPFGHAHDIAVTGPPQLVPCITSTLDAMRVNRRTPRETRATVDLSFTNLQGVKHEAPPPPPIPETRPGCLVARDPLPVDTIELAGLDIDFEPPTEHPRRQHCGRFDVDKAEIRAMVRANLGNLRACYLAAAKRAPGLGGTLTTQFTLGPWGQPTQITIGGAGDAAFHDCMKTQLELTATQRMPDGAVQINLPFTLDPTPAHAWSSPAEALEAGDASEAALMFAKLGDAATDVDQACRARLGIVKAYANLPGGPDARTDKAIADLAAFMAAHADGIAGCRDDAGTDLVAIARWPVRPKADDLTPFRGAGLDEAVARSTKILALFPHLARELLPFIGRALTAMHRNDDAFGAYLRYFALGDSEMSRVIWAADGYAESQREREDGVPWDTCEATAKY
jgi:hypothetical protein